MTFFKRLISVLKVNLINKNLDENYSPEQEKEKKLRPKLQYVPDWAYLTKDHDWYKK